MLSKRRKSIKHSMNNDSIESNIFASILIVIYAIVYLLQYVKIIPLFTGNLLFCLLGMTSIFYCFVKKGFNNQKPFILFLWIYSLLGMVSYFINSNIDILEFFWPFAFMGLGLLLLNFKLSVNMTKYIYYFSCVLLMAIISRAGNVNVITFAASRNTISIITLLFLSIYLITCYKNEVNVTIFPVIIGTIVVIFAIGRSGIITFALLSILFLIFEFQGRKSKIRNVFKILIVLCLIILLMAIAFYIFKDYFILTINNFKVRQLDSLRTFIWSDYLSKTFTSTKYLLFGSPINGTLYLDMYSKNLHNSFFMLHAKYGLIMLLIVLFLIYKSLKYFYTTKNYLLLSIFLISIYRMNFDYTNFNGALDIIFIFFILYPYYAKN
jgi:hypothetical protein